MAQQVLPEVMPLLAGMLAGMQVVAGVDLDKVVEPEQDYILLIQRVSVAVVAVATMVAVAVADMAVVVAAPETGATVHLWVVLVAVEVV